MSLLACEMHHRNVAIAPVFSRIKKCNVLTQATNKFTRGPRATDNEKVMSMEISELCREANRKNKKELQETNICTTC